ncbi:hypothetical protein FBU30_000036 [Linnemannia zychae]|nr:hypothetical protein FBU30_000036 [Linnemannia zychae]
MSTLHCDNSNSNISSPWSSPKDRQQKTPLKRRHTRGNTASHPHSHSRTSIRSLSLSPAVSSISMSENTSPLSSSPGFKGQNNSSWKSHSVRRDPEFQYDYDMNGSSHDLHQQQQQQQNEGNTKSSKNSHAGPISGAVPSWFGSLRSFAISATSNSRGAFAPLSTSSPSLSSSSSSSSPKHSRKSRGRSSSIYYSSTLMDSEDESGSEWSSGQDEPITSLNGLKENRVRGPRVNWMALDPSLGNFFGERYKALPTNESDHDLSSPEAGCEDEEGREASKCIGGVEALRISEAPYRDDEEYQSGDEARRRRSGYERSGSDDNSNVIQSRVQIGGDENSTRARVMDDSLVLTQEFTMHVNAPSSTLAFLKSYVPSLGGGNPTNTVPSQTTSSSTAAMATGISPASPPAPAGGFWSLRKISMNFLGSNQYAAVGKGDKEDDDGEEKSDDLQQMHQPREQGRRAGYRDDDDDDAHRRPTMRMVHDDVVSKEIGPTTTTTSSSGNSTVSYLASMVQNATQAGVQYIPVQVRDQLPTVVANNRGLKKD